MIPEIKLIGRKFKRCPLFDVSSGWFIVTIFLIMIGLMASVISGIYYLAWLPDHLERQAMLDIINSYECADLNDWLKTNWKSMYFDEFHNKWVMNC